MLEQIAQQEYTKIDEEAKQKKEVIDFICEYINSNYDKFETIFRQKRNKTNKEEVLYERTKEMLEEVEKEGIRFIGILSCFSKRTCPATQTGLIEYVKFGERFTPKMTSEGEKIINEYRKAKGLKSVGDCLKAQSKYWNRE